MTGIFELREYSVEPGRMAELLGRFGGIREVFADCGMRAVGFWSSEERPNEFVYLLEHSGSPISNWAHFADDPRWRALLTKGRPRVDVVSRMLRNAPFPE